MAKELSRREFVRLTLKSLGALGIAGIIGERASAFRSEHSFDPTLEIWTDRDREHLSFEELVAVARRLDVISDTIDYLPEVSPERLDWWVREIVPYFEYEGATNRLVYPEKIDFYEFREGRGHNHVLGRADCIKQIALNTRMDNPVSSWYRTQDFVPTLVHELVHLQQGELCWREGSENIENTAQIVSWEVLAAMALGGNREAAYALIHELRGAFLSAAMGRAIKNKRTGEFEAILRSLSPSFTSWARYQKSNRYWQDKSYDRMIILEKYSIRPLERVVEAFQNGRLEIDGLALNNSYFDTGSPAGPRMIFLPFEVDDLAYFFKYCEDIIGAYNQN